MLIRHHAALGLIEHEDEEGRLALLAQIVAPNPGALAASMEEAERRGPSLLAKQIASPVREGKRPSQARVAPGKRREWAAV